MDIAALEAGLKNLKETTASVKYLPRLVFSKGVWSLDGGESFLEKDSEWVWFIDTMEHGYTCWTNYPKEMRTKNVLVAEEWSSFTEPRRKMNDLPEQYDPKTDAILEWKPATRVVMGCLKGVDKGTVVQFTTSTTGGLNLMDYVCEELVKRVNLDVKTVYPVTEFYSDMYTHTNYGLTHIPKARIVDWKDSAGIDALSGQETLALEFPEDTEEKAAEEEETEAPAPSKRRRRAVAS